MKFDTEFSWSDHVARLSDRDFKLRYRLTLPAFNELLEMLSPHLKVQDENQARIAKWGELITEEAKLACALRYLAGGDVKDLQLIYHFSPNHVYKCIWLVASACRAGAGVSGSCWFDQVVMADAGAVGGAES